MSIINRGSSIDASYQVSVHLAEGSEEKIKMWRVNGRQTTDDGCQELTLPLARWAKKCSLYLIQQWITHLRIKSTYN